VAAWRPGGRSTGPPPPLVHPTAPARAGAAPLMRPAEYVRRFLNPTNSTPGYTAQPVHTKLFKPPAAHGGRNPHEPAASRPNPQAPQTRQPPASPGTGHSRQPRPRTQSRPPPAPHNTPRTTQANPKKAHPPNPTTQQPHHPGTHNPANPPTNHQQRGRHGVKNPNSRAPATELTPPSPGARARTSYCRARRDQGNGCNHRFPSTRVPWPRLRSRARHTVSQACPAARTRPRGCSTTIPSRHAQPQECPAAVFSHRIQPTTPSRDCTRPACPSTASPAYSTTPGHRATRAGRGIQPRAHHGHTAHTAARHASRTPRRTAGTRAETQLRASQEKAHRAKPGTAGSTRQQPPPASQTKDAERRRQPPGNPPVRKTQTRCTFLTPRDLHTRAATPARPHP
jgi:hypothetical protein